MTREQAIHRLQEDRSTLQSLGVARTALLRRDLDPSDRPVAGFDVMVEFAPTARISIYDFASVEERLQKILAGPVDVVSLDVLRQSEPKRLDRAVYAF